MENVKKKRYWLRGAILLGSCAVVAFGVIEILWRLKVIEYHSTYNGISWLISLPAFIAALVLFFVTGKSFKPFYEGHSWSTVTFSGVLLAIADLEMTRVVDGNLVKVLGWYDNEMGYTHTLVEPVIKAGRS